MRCPKDATIDKELQLKILLEKNVKLCRSVNDNLQPFRCLCTRPKGHKGLHHAHDLDDKCCGTWK